MSNSSAGVASAALAHKLLPILDWLPTYRREWAWPDVLAGLALWAVMVPEGMAYAGIVGVPPVMGLYTIVPALFAYALLGTSRQLVVGPDTATGLISSLTVGAMATQGTVEFNTLTSTLAVLIGIFFFSFGVMRMGWVASFISTPVMRGFIEGLVYVTIIGQVPHLLGISGASGNFFVKLWNVLQHLPDVSVAPALIGILCLAAMLLFRYFAPAAPAALIVLAVATIAIGLLGGEATGVHVAGHIPSGLPHLAPPDLDPKILYELAPGALAIVLVGYAEALGAAKAAAMQGGGDIDPNQELIAHGPANILSGLFGGFLVVGSLSKTSVVTAAGARSQVANLVAAVFCLFTLIWLTPLFRNMPQPALAAIVIAAMLHLTKPKYLLNLFARNRGAFANTVIVIVAELTLGVLQGHRSGRGAVACDFGLPNQSSAGGGAWPAAKYRGVSRCSTSSRSHNFSGIVDLANGRRPLLCERWSRGRDVKTVAGCAAGGEAGAPGLQSGQFHRRHCWRRTTRAHQRAKNPRNRGCFCAPARRSSGRYAACRDRGNCGPAQFL